MSYHEIFNHYVTASDKFTLDQIESLRTIFEDVARTNLQGVSLKRMPNIDDSILQGYVDKNINTAWEMFGF